MDEREKHWRARALAALIFLGFALVAAQLFSLQVLHHEHYSEAARENRQFSRRVLAPRGIISDRNGIDLAHNVYQARITYPRRLARPDDEVLRRAIALLGLDSLEVFERIAGAPPGDRVTLIKRATPEQVAIFEEHRPQLPQMQAEILPRRHYRFGSLATHILGHVGEVRREETERDGFYRAGDVIGRQGIEAREEAGLRGEHGSRVVMVNASGHVVGELPDTGRDARPGVEVYLTVHKDLQARLEELLEGKVGAGVVFDVATGDLLAVASAPSYDPNEFTAGIRQDRLDEIQNDPRKPLFNRALHGVYPPGSPFKLVTAAAALERGRVDPHERLEPCRGGYQFGNRWFGCWKPEGHGSLDLQGAIVQSCDTYFYQLAQRLSVDELAETARAFGFGASTGLQPLSDRTGLVPDTSWYDEHLGKGAWTQGVLLNLGIGQGELLVTPLQMARTYAAIGGDGHLYRPQLVMARRTDAGVLTRARVARTSRAICSERTRRFLRRALRQVVADEEGTGGLAQVDGIPVAGKTGTAENPFGEDHAWFVAYAPADAPEISVALIIENAGHGGSIAAPLVGELLHTYFSLPERRASAVRATR